MGICPCVSKRIKYLDYYFCVKKMIKVGIFQEKCVQVSKKTLSTWGFRTWKLLLYSFLMVRFTDIPCIYLCYLVNFTLKIGTCHVCQKNFQYRSVTKS